MAKKKPPKNHLSSQIPTGSASSSLPSSPSSQQFTPEGHSAVKSVSSKAAPLAKIDDSLAKSGNPSAQVHAPATSLSSGSGNLIHDSATVPENLGTVPGTENTTLDQTAAMAATQETSMNSPDPASLWSSFVKGSTVKLEPKETPYTLDSGEACVTIPNSVIEKNQKAWDSFILGQFYEESPPRGAVHAILNGIWSRQRRDITVSKMEGNAFLFKVPCPHARRRILSQSLWQVDGQTMFVAKWSPGPRQAKPELSMVPVWLEFSGVPLQFFNREGLQEIAGMVGHPICLHPATKNLTNIEVAKVYTVIDPRKPLPEGVNARFESGEIARIKVSSPWLPSLCSFCKKVGHTISRCTAAPPTCIVCKSVKHNTDNCPRAGTEKSKGKAPLKSMLPIVTQPGHISRDVVPDTSKQISNKSAPNSTLASHQPSHQNLLHVDSLDLAKGNLCVDLAYHKEASASGTSEDDPSSGLRSASDDEDNTYSGHDKFIEVISKRAKKIAKMKSLTRAGGPSNL